MDDYDPIEDYHPKDGTEPLWGWAAAIISAGIVIAALLMFLL